MQAAHPNLNGWCRCVRNARLPAASAAWLVTASMASSAFSMATTGSGTGGSGAGAGTGAGSTGAGGTTWTSTTSTAGAIVEAAAIDNGLRGTLPCTTLATRSLPQNKASWSELINSLYNIQKDYEDLPGASAGAMGTSSTSRYLAPACTAGIGFNDSDNQVKQLNKQKNIQMPAPASPSEPAGRTAGALAPAKGPGRLARRP